MRQVTVRTHSGNRLLHTVTIPSQGAKKNCRLYSCLSDAFERTHVAITGVVTPDITRWRELHVLTPTLRDIKASEIQLQPRLPIAIGYSIEQITIP